MEEIFFFFLSRKSSFSPVLETRVPSIATYTHTPARARLALFKWMAPRTNASQLPTRLYLVTHSHKFEERLSSARTNKTKQKSKSRWTTFISTPDEVDATQEKKIINQLDERKEEKIKKFRHLLV